MYNWRHGGYLDWVYWIKPRNKLPRELKIGFPVDEILFSQILQMRTAANSAVATKRLALEQSSNCSLIFSDMFPRAPQINTSLGYQKRLPANCQIYCNFY